jgi:CRP/FNR family transcriptional regulator, cyclic AMP receptor protein
MPPVLDADLAVRKLASLPIETHQKGSVVLAAGATTGKLLMLKEGAVEVVQGGVRLAEVSEPGAVFGEIAALLGQPHTADVRALRRSVFHVADGRSYLRADPTAALYVAMLLARRLQAVNRHLVEARSRLGEAPPAGVVAEMIDNIALTLRYGPPL